MERSISFKYNLQGNYKFPLAFPKQKDLKELSGNVLAADVGGTKTNLSLYQVSDGMLQPLKQKSYVTKDHSSFQEIVKKFKNEDLPEIDSLCLGVAGPVNEGVVKGTNFPWIIDKKEIGKELSIKNVEIINDMEANAFGLGALDDSDFVEIRKGSEVAGNAVIISPGTGLGEAGLFWDARAYHPFATEGGHSEFSPRNEFDADLWRFLQGKYGLVSWERIISGSGIYDIYQFLIITRGIREPTWFKERILQEDPAALISASAIAGNYHVCKESIDLFVRYLAIESNQFALKTKATGGIFIGGGIVPKIIKTIDKEIFNENFIKSDRMEHLLELMPVKAILNEKTATYGAALYGAMML
ncbi:glucokinase [Gillisia limnaea]|uniref:Glucokinase n=1 Tax=Gillisia limnaea (strain DSM 15749 / LMG 21470 / R-8282) TaxID=865937 RepID=H2BTD2_GILLR|nr:glucokinase [Gillisia limnaea]EHQ03731.1 Glucokinase [Gillisia limnaea DSM 15749]